MTCRRRYRIALVLVGPAMIYYLCKEMPSNQPKRGVCIATLVEERQFDKLD